MMATAAASFRPPRGALARMIVPALAVHTLIMFLPLFDFKLDGPHPNVVFADLPVFFRYASKMLIGYVPYRDFIVEYPPFALPIFLLPRLLSGNDFGLYAVLFALQMLFWDGLCVVLVAWWMTRRGEFPLLPGVLLWYTLFFAALYPLVGPHYDLVPATVAFAAAAAWGSERPTTGGLLAAGAAFLKAFPGAVALPGIISELRGLGRRRPAGTAAFALALLSGGTAWWAIGAVNAVRFVALRGLEIGSFWAAALAATGTLRHAPMGTHFFQTAYQLRAPGAETLARMAVPLQGLALLFVAWRICRLKNIDVMRMSAAAVLVCVIAGKAFSPQYMIWLLPFAAVSSDRLARSLFLLASVLTTTVFPWRFLELVTLQPVAIALLTARNALLIALLVVWLWERGDEESSTRCPDESPEHVP